MNLDFDPTRDLKVERLIRAPRAMVWDAWADPDKFARWWLPAPHQCRVVEMELNPGGALVTEMSTDDGPFEPHMSSCFLAVEDGRRIVFTTCLTGGWRPADKTFMTGIITFDDHPEGTSYAATALHAGPAEKDRHAALGFHEGWGAVTEQLARLAEGG
jgi:uncharacterized protein YndB with AHSA1/START domain